ncbi:MAG: hypothetical protein ACLQVM_15630 [Terriglobia bacterium]
MSIAILIGVHDGLVLASDSASTLVLTTPGGTGGQVGTLANVYENANKIFNLIKGEPIGCVTYGTGSIGNASIATLIKDLRQKLTDPKTAEEFDFDRANYTMQELSEVLAKFLDQECSKIDGAAQQNTNIGFLVGGYSSGESLGQSWFVDISQGKSKPPLKLRKDDETGISWGGQGEVVQRMVLGFSPGIFQILAEVSQPEQNTPEFRQKLSQLLTARLQAPLIFAPMPIQDAIDLGEFLVHAAITYSRFLPGYQVVGGPIEVAAITKHEGFKWISRKHYFDKSLNPEPTHVVID